MQAGRSDRTKGQMPPFLMTKAGRIAVTIVCALIILAVVIGTYFTARIASDADLKAANLRVVQVQNDNQKLIAENTDLLGTIADLQLRIKPPQANLPLILPPTNT